MNSSKHFQFFLLFALYLLPTLNVSAQSVDADEMLKWIQSVEQEFPGFKFTNNNIRDKTYKIKYYNLFSDKYFLPTFGLRFDDLSESQREKILDKVNNWRSKGGNKGLIYWDYSSLLEPLSTNNRVAYTYEKVAKEVVEMREARLKYNTALSRIKSKNLTFEELVEIKYDIPNKYKNLMPSEIEHLNTTMNQDLREAADARADKQLSKINLEEKTLSTLNEIGNFETNNSRIVAFVSSPKKAQLLSDLNSMKNEVLNHLMKEEEKTLFKLGSISDDWEKYDKWYNNFQDKYKKYNNHEKVFELDKMFRAKKAKSIDENSQSIKAEIVESTSEHELITIRDKYFNNLNVEFKSKWMDLIREKVNELKEEKAMVIKEAELQKLMKVMSETTPTGEPTEEQMRFALELKINNKNSMITGLSEIEYQKGDNDPAKATLTLVGMAVKGLSLRLTSFEKYACISAENSGKPGYVCDYASEVRIDGGIDYRIFPDIGGETISTARFLKKNGVWIIVEEIK